MNRADQIIEKIRKAAEHLPSPNDIPPTDREGRELVKKVDRAVEDADKHFRRFGSRENSQ